MLVIQRIEQTGWTGQVTPEMVKKEVDRESVLMIKAMQNERLKRQSLSQWIAFSSNRVCHRVLLFIG